jgi:natural product precursor
VTEQNQVAKLKDLNKKRVRSFKYIIILNKTTMKKVKFEGKLSLNKQTVAKLSNEEMTSIKGGFTSMWGCSTNDVTRGGNCCPPGTTSMMNGSCKPR